MPPLNTALRSALENKIIAARDAAERAAREALERVDVALDSPRASLSESDRRLRNQLRAEARRLDPLRGDDGGKGDSQTKTVRGFPLLIAECAYEQWHRMLFARFLSENNLLMHPDGISLTLEDCRELAPHEGFPDAWSAAAGYASRMLPGIFREGDPTLQIRLAPEGRQALEAILTGIPESVFTSDDGLGWVYQFWQTKAKREVNAKGQKISGADISPVTQLFTEHYMVEFLLHNTLGAWWATRHPHSPINGRLTYLRRLEDGTPAAGGFPGWAQSTAALRVIDPCCGSGHFLTATAELLAAMRAEEEGLSLSAAFERVLSDNLFGLELDPRCTQLAAFSLALQAWRNGGYRKLPTPNIACSGIPVGGRRDDWLALAPSDPKVRTTLQRLWELFKNAADLGSLIDPNRVTDEMDLYAADFNEVETVFMQAVERSKSADDPAASVFGEAVRGVARAAALLRGKYDLVITNVPYLARGKQGETLKDHLERFYPTAKADLATAFVERCRDFCVTGGSYALVTPQNWLFLGSYKHLRENLLITQSWNTVSRLGAGAFETIGGEVVNVALLAITNSSPAARHIMTGLDVSAFKTPLEKAGGLEGGAVKALEQAGQLKNPDARVGIEPQANIPLLSAYAVSYWGIGSGDSSRFARQFWEVSLPDPDWEYLQVTFSDTALHSGNEQILYWQNGNGELFQLAEALKERLKNIWRRGSEAWGRSGISISQMGSLAATLYDGEIFQNGLAAVIPKNPDNLMAIWAFCSSKEFGIEVRKIDQKLSVLTTGQKWNNIVQHKLPGAPG